MDQQTSEEIRRSWPAGMLGGGIGYAIGAYFDLPWVAYVLFFVGGYFGYHYKATLIATVQVFEESVWPSLQLLFGLAVALLVLAVKIGAFLGYFALVAWLAFKTYIVFEQIGLYAWVPSTESAFGVAANLIFFSLHWMFWLMSPLFASIVLAVAYEAYKDPRKAWLYVRSLPGKIVHSTLFAIIIAPYAIPKLLLKAFAMIVLKIHSERRVTMALTTLSSGAAYLWWQPFSMRPGASGLAAIGCAAFAGLCCSAMAWLLDGQALAHRLQSFVSSSANPLAWINKIEVDL